MTEDGRYLILGANIFDLKEKRDLTYEATEGNLKLDPKVFRELDRFVAFTQGSGDRTVYLITDPDCPFCKQLEKTLKKLTEAGKIRVKVLLFPLIDFHPNAKDRAVSIICDNKRTLDALIGNYQSQNRCPRGEELVERTIEKLSELGAQGTPILILDNGKVIKGGDS